MSYSHLSDSNLFGYVLTLVDMVRQVDNSYHLWQLQITIFSICSTKFSICFYWDWNYNHVSDSNLCGYVLTLVDMVSQVDNSYLLLSYSHVSDTTLSGYVLTLVDMVRQVDNSYLLNDCRYNKFGIYVTKFSIYLLRLSYSPVSDTNLSGYVLTIVDMSGK